MYSALYTVLYIALNAHGGDLLLAGLLAGLLGKLVEVALQLAGGDAVQHLGQNTMNRQIRVAADGLVKWA